ncbi:YdcF family protein [Cohnella lubricantis]|uniref:YdcF family protein n=2 Tax=Cohnella lubricantis TaxID=2163172 RepID=A0A841TEC2_9BACL|nr:YdcF family protein [Cohnella lubricantis]
MERSAASHDKTTLPSGTSLRARQRRSKRPLSKRLLRLALYCLVAGFIALIVWCAALFMIIVRFEGQPGSVLPKGNDVGIVLGASLWSDRPSPGLLERLDYALSLYEEGVFERFLVSGGLDDNGATITEAEGMRRYLTAQGVPDADIVLEPKEHSTLENLKFSQAIMSENGWHTAVIVTHQYHGSRAANIAKALRYDPVQVSVTDSRVLHLTYNRTREVLAYTKWLADKWLLHAA